MRFIVLRRHRKVPGESSSESSSSSSSLPVIEKTWTSSDPDRLDVSWLFPQRALSRGARAFLLLLCSPALFLEQPRGKEEERVKEPKQIEAVEEAGRSGAIDGTKTEEETSPGRMFE